MRGGVMAEALYALTDLRLSLPDMTRKPLLGPAPRIEILKGLRPRYEAHHKVRISDEALASAVELSVRYISDRQLPDKAIDVMDEVGARKHIKNIKYCYNVVFLFHNFMVLTQTDEGRKASHNNF